MSTSGPEETPPPPELQGLDPKDLLKAGLETVPPVTLLPQPGDADATLPMARPRSTQPAAQVELPLPEELTTLLPGGNYHVESFLGQGGMGAVYKGMQVRLKRPVAIKIMRRDMGKDYDFEARFEREAQAMAKLNHPNIVSVIDYGEAGPDYLYIVMELIDGADLMDVIRGGQMTQEMALSLLPQICDALQFAHDHGIVHRDIKPSNIMVTRDGRVKMADFGLAKPMDRIESGFRTQTGTGMGTPDYAAPEQFDPSGHIDHRADIYALGVMIYQMITGQLPRGAWKRPSERAAVAPQWDEIVSRAMQSDPSDRYQQASEVKTDVSSIPLAQGRAAGPSAAANGPQAALGGPSALPRSNSRAALAIGTFVIGLIAFAAVIFAPREKESDAVVASSTSQQPAPAATTSNATKPTAPSKAGSEGPKSSVATATKDAPFVNTLGMKFVPVPITGGPTDKQRVLFSVWETRLQDYEVFAKEMKTHVQKAPFDQEPTHPVANILIDKATAFCQWLTERERQTGKLGVEEGYRLPTDHEWSCAAGIGAKENANELPYAKKEKMGGVYAWGTQWPPPDGSGNFWSEELRPLIAKGVADRNPYFSKIIGELSGYHDGYAVTAPVGSFTANNHGVHDLDGNVAEYCQDWYWQEQTKRTIRGASWDSAGPERLRIAYRYSQDPTAHNYNTGFRIVLVRDTKQVTTSAEKWEVAQEDSGKMARIADGWRVEGSLSFKNGPARDGAVRVRAPFTPELQNVRLVGRKSADGQDLYQVFINSDGARASIQRRKKGEYTGVEGLAATPLATPLKPGEPCDLEARFVGPEITVKINGQTVLQGDHQTLAEGSFGLYTSASTPVTLKSIEFLNLEERPTSEPWQDMLQDLRFGVYGAVERTPEGLHFSSKGTARLKQGTLRDMSVRLTSTFTGKIGPQVNVRVSTKGSYHLFVKDNRTLRWGRWDEAAQQTVMQKEFHLDKPLATGQEYQLELRVIGQTFTAKLDGKVVGTATDGPPTSGELGAGVAGPEATSIVITALEFLNLDEPGSASPSLPLSNSSSSATGDAPIINDRGR